MDRRLLIIILLIIMIIVAIFILEWLGMTDFIPGVGYGSGDIYACPGVGQGSGDA